MFGFDAFAVDEFWKNCGRGSFMSENIDSLRPRVPQKDARRLFSKISKLAELEMFP